MKGDQKHIPRSQRSLKKKRNILESTLEGFLGRNEKGKDPWLEGWTIYSLTLWFSPVRS